MSKQPGKSTELKVVLETYSPVLKNAAERTLIDMRQEQAGAAAKTEGCADATHAAGCVGGFTSENGSHMLEKTILEPLVSHPEDSPPSYQPVLPYGEIAKLVCRYRRTMPESTHNALNELAEALEYAAAQVKDRNSERSYFDGADISFCAVMDATLDLSPAMTHFVAKLAEQMTDAFDVIRSGHDIRDKPNLQNPVGQLARILCRKERSNTTPRLPDR